MNERKEQSWSYVVVFAILFILMLIALKTTLESPGKDDYVKITVEHGDTLWGLSENYRKQHDFSNKNFVSWVEKTNNVQSRFLRPGETLVIPVERNN